MKICIIGSSGYLGSELLFQAEKLGHEAIGTFHNTDQGSTNQSYFSVENTDQLPEAEVYIWSANGYDSGEADQTLRTLNSVRLIYISSDVTSSDTTLSADNSLGQYARHKQHEEKLVDTNRNLVLRVGPVYGKNSAGMLDKRSQRFLEDCAEGNKAEYWYNVYKTFEPIELLAKSIIRFSCSELSGTHFLGPKSRLSYYQFYRKLLTERGLDPSMLVPSKLDRSDARKLGIGFDTSYSNHGSSIELN